MTSLVTSPLDVVKTRLQSAAVPSVLPSTLKGDASMVGSGGSHACDVCGASGGSSSASGRGLAGASSLRGVPPASAVSTLLNVVRREGILTLWSGLKPSLIMAVPSTTLYFAAYEELKGRIEAQARGHSGSGGGHGFSGSGHSQSSSIDTSNSNGGSHGCIPLGAAPLVAGVAGRVFAVTVVSPLELLRTREMYRRSHMPLLSALAAEVRANGGRLSSLWRGFAATLWRDVPFSGIYWLSYEGCKARLRDWRLQSLAAATNPVARTSGNGERIGGGPMHRPSRSASAAAASAASAAAYESAPQLAGLSSPPAAQLGFVDTFAIAFASGVASGGLAALATTPFDVVKTRRQVDASRGAAGAGASGSGGARANLASATASTASAALSSGVIGGPKPAGGAAAASTASASVIAEHGTLGSLACIARTEGLRGLFAGVTARVAKVAPSCAIMIASYEIGKRFLGTMAEKDSLRESESPQPVRSSAAEPAAWAPTMRSSSVVADRLGAAGCGRWRDGGINVVEAEEEMPPT